MISNHFSGYYSNGFVELTFQWEKENIKQVQNKISTIVVDAYKLSENNKLAYNNMTCLVVWKMKVDLI